MLNTNTVRKIFVTDDGYHLRLYLGSALSTVNIYKVPRHIINKYPDSNTY